MIGDNGETRTMCITVICPNCGSARIGDNLFGSTDYVCRDCGKQFSKIDIKK